MSGNAASDPADPRRDAPRAGTWLWTLPREAAALLLVLVLAIVLRGWQLQESLWLDELHTAWVIEAGWSEIPRRAAIGNQSPLYFGLPWLSTAVFGWAEWSLRLPSLLAGLGLVAATWYAVRRWSNSASAGLVAAMLVALDRNCIFYAQEARPYAWVQLLGLIHVYLFWRTEADPTARRRITLVAAGVGLFWLHYTAALLFAAEWSWWSLRRVWRPKRSLYTAGQLAADGGLLAAGCLPALPHLLEIAAQRGNWAQFVRRAPPTVAVEWFSLFIYLLLPLAVLALDRALHMRAPAARRVQRGLPLMQLPFWLPLCWFFVPVGLAWLLTWLDVTRLFFPRYVIAAAVAPICMAALCLAACRRAARGVLAVTLLLSAVVYSGMPQQWRHDGRLLADRNQNWRAAAAWLVAQSDEHRLPVLLRSGLLEADRLRDDPSPLLIRYCLLPLTGLYDVSAAVPAMIPLPTSEAGELSSDALRQVEQYGGAWLVVNGSASSRAQIRRAVVRRLTERGSTAEISAQRRFGTVEVLRLSAAPQH